MALTPDLKIDFKPDTEKRARRKKSAQELSDKFGAASGNQTGTMSQMPNSKAPDAMQMASSAMRIGKLVSMFLSSDKKLKKNIKTISNFMEILYG